ncbi:hypothetical protein GCM10009737_17130 [Nocardioides lentus]|uniref:N-acetyltransferase domain-containing protein n=1 Tax=Nocardioides lentus TaxID=338077 RepID=A0ABP5AM01_9ACTN
MSTDPRTDVPVTGPVEGELAGTYRGWRVEIRRSLDADVRDELHALYERAFGPLRTLAAARHVLTRAEFDEEMTAPTVDKYVALTADGTVAGLSTFTNDLSTVPWISPEYYAHRYPGPAARGAVYYLGITLTDPAHRRTGAFEAVQEAVKARLIAEDAVCVWDMCAANVEAGFADAISRFVGDRAVVAPTVVDTQHYFAADFDRTTPGGTP